MAHGYVVSATYTFILWQRKKEMDSLSSLKRILIFYESGIEDTTPYIK